MPTSSSKASIFLPVLIMLIGTGWLLSAWHVIPDVNWVWVLALAGAGVLTLALGGLNALTVFVGPFLILCAGASVLRQTGRIDINTEIPVLTIAAGALMLLARFLPLPPVKPLKPNS